MPIVKCKITGHRSFQSKAGKDCCIVSWLEAYIPEEGKGYAAYSAFVSPSQSHVFLDFCGKDVECYVTHSKGNHTIDYLGDR